MARKLPTKVPTVSPAAEEVPAVARTAAETPAGASPVARTTGEFLAKVTALAHNPDCGLLATPVRRQRLPLVAETLCATVSRDRP